MLVNPVCSGSGVSEQPSRDSDDAQTGTCTLHTCISMSSSLLLCSQIFMCHFLSKVSNENTHMKKY